MTTIINLYGGPASGKSTSAAYLYYVLKAAGENVEMVREYVKAWAWENRPFGVYDELYFLGKQVRHESMLFGKVDWIVTDAPVYMTAYYASLYCSPQLAQGVLKATQAFYHQAEADGHRHVHIMLNRNRPYQAEGRYQTEEQALAVDKGIQKLLQSEKVSLIDTTTSEKDLLLALNRSADFTLMRAPDGQMVKITNAMASTLSEYVLANAAKLAGHYSAIVVGSDYQSVEGDDIEKFLRTTAHLQQNWKPLGVKSSTLISFPNALEVVFENTVVDNGESMFGFVVLDFSGKILHSFVMVND